MVLTNTEKKMIGKVGAGESISKNGMQYLHSLVFSGGKTIANIKFVSNIPYMGCTEVISVRDWDKKNFQIVHGLSSASYPPKAHLTELKSGISEVISKLENGKTEYEIIKKVPKERQLVFPEKYKFEHDIGYHETLKGYVRENRTRISDWYLYRGKWDKGDTFCNGYTIPENVGFLENFLGALTKLDKKTI
jgi:hypothetical protein